MPLPMRKRSEPAMKLPRLTSGVPWQPSEDVDGVVIATINTNQVFGNGPGSPLSASVKSIVTEAPSDLNRIEEAQSGRTSLRSQETALGTAIAPVLTLSRHRLIDSQIPSTPRMSSAMGSLVAGSMRCQVNATPVLSARGRCDGRFEDVAVRQPPGSPVQTGLVAATPPVTTALAQPNGMILPLAETYVVGAKQEDFVSGPKLPIGSAGGLLSASPSAVGGLGIPMGMETVVPTAVQGNSMPPQRTISTARLVTGSPAQPPRATSPVQLHRTASPSQQRRPSSPITLTPRVVLANNVLPDTGASRMPESAGIRLRLGERAPARATGENGVRKACVVPVSLKQQVRADVTPAVRGVTPQRVARQTSLSVSRTRSPDYGYSMKVPLGASKGGAFRVAQFSPRIAQ